MKNGENQISDAQKRRLDRLNSALQSIRHEVLVLEGRDCALGQPKTVLEHLKIAVPEISPDSWPRRLASGGVHLNGLRVKDDILIDPPAKIEYFEPRSSESVSGSQADPFATIPRFSPSWIVYEDEDLLACFKPRGLPALPAREQEHLNLRSYLEAYTKAPVHMPSRLDMSTAGLCLISKSLACHAPLQHAFERRSVHKHYLFLTHASPSWEIHELQAPIGYDPLHPVLRKVDGDRAKSATTTFRVILRPERDSDPGTLLQATPLTGRTHQIRVHSAHLGLPIRGDNFYEGATDSQLHLLSFAVSLPHPIHGAPLNLALPKTLWPSWLPEGFTGLHTPKLF